MSKTSEYIKQIYRTSLDGVSEEFGSVKGNTLALLIGLVATSIVLAISVYVGVTLGWPEVWANLKGLFLGDAILLVSLWVGKYFFAFFRLPAVAARRDFAKDELIKTLSKTERPEAGKLARLRTKGVDLRNKGAAIVNEQQLGLWINEYEKWNKQMLSVARKLSPSVADWLKTLDTMPTIPPISPPKWVNGEHLRYARVWSEKLQRLDTVVRAQLGLTK